MSQDRAGGVRRGVLVAGHDLLDPAYDAVTWAMTNGKVTSDRITVEARGLAIPQLIQATSAKQYDVIMTAVIAIPPAAARGLELKVLSTALQQ